MQDAIKCVFWF